jgi:tetratricopeptide (TPR) repeat protein
MPSSARVLRFRARRPSGVPLSPEEATSAARRYLEAASERSPESTSDALSNADVLSSTLRLLREQWATSPQSVSDEAVHIYRWLQNSERIGLFDERDYFLGEAAFIAGTASKFLGNRVDALRWLDRAEAGFRHTVNAAPGLSSVSYARLCVRFDMGRFDDVVDLMPSLVESFKKLEMPVEAAKAKLVLAMALKNSGRVEDALTHLEAVGDEPCMEKNPTIRAQVLSERGDALRMTDRIDEAMSCYREALPLLASGQASAGRADLRMFVAGAYRAKGALDTALTAFKSAASDYKELGMATRAAYVGVLISETLLALDRPREAEWEILQALPTIEEQKMVPEGFAAVALLRESVKRRKTDPNALRELREHLQKQN